MRFAETAWASYRLLFTNWRAFLLPALAWSAAIAGTELLAAITANAPTAEADMFLVRLAPYLLNILIAIGGWLCIAIVWHRFVILGEPASRFFPGSVDVIGPYLARMLALMLPMLAIYAIVMWRYWTESEYTAAQAIWYAGAALMGAAAARLLLIFPASATGDTAITMRMSWAATRGHGLHLFAGLLLCDAPLMLTLFGIDVAIQDLDYQSPESIMATAAMHFIDLARSVVWTTFLSYAYLEFAHPVRSQADAFR